jgi:hypothetical protein
MPDLWGERISTRNELFPQSPSLTEKDSPDLSNKVWRSALFNTSTSTNSKPLNRSYSLLEVDLGVDSNFPKLFLPKMQLFG